MGNCAGTTRQSTLDLGVATNTAISSSKVRLFGSSTSPETYQVRIALLLKGIEIQFIPSSSSQESASFPVTLQFGKETVTGSNEWLLKYLDSRFPEPCLMPKGRWEEPSLVAAVRLQHASITWHLSQMLCWAENLSTKTMSSECSTIDPTLGSPRMEIKKFGRHYSRLLEVMLEHAQMEERVVFPVLEKADRGICKFAFDEHAEELPIMNGIKEDIKSIGVLDIGSQTYQEALNKLSIRLKILLAHSRDHFEEEERDLLPLLEAADMGAEQQDIALRKCFHEVMENSHSRLFRFLIYGLSPEEAMQYLNLTAKCCDRDKAGLMFASLTTADWKSWLPWGLQD